MDKNASKHLSFYYCATFPHIHFGYLKKLIRIHHVKKFYGSMMRKMISDFLDTITLWFIAQKFKVSYSMILGAKIQMQWAVWGGDQFFPGIFSTVLFLWPQGFPEIPRNALWKKKGKFNLHSFTQNETRVTISFGFWAFLLRTCVMRVVQYSV